MVRDGPPELNGFSAKRRAWPRLGDRAILRFMHQDDHGSLRQWVECWARAGRKLDELRREDLQTLDTQQALAALAGAFESALIHSRPEPSSGLVEQQRLFRLLRT